MADKQVTVAVPEERVPEFYVWFAHFLADGEGPAGGGPPPRGGPSPGGPPRHGGPPHRGGPSPWSGPRHARGFRSRPQFEAAAWTADDADEAAWLYIKLAPPARELLDLLIAEPGKRFSGNEIAARLKLDKGAHGVAGILAWPGRYSRKLGRELPIATAGRDDGGTDYYLEPEVAQLFDAARKRADA